MTFLTFKLLGWARSPMAANESSILPLQVRSKEEQGREASKVISTSSRRNVMLDLAAVSLSGITLFSTRPVEAGVGKLENKRKVREKLELLREKARASKTKASPPQLLAKEEKQLFPLLPPSTPLPGSGRIPTEPLFETTLP